MQERELTTSWKVESVTSVFILGMTQGLSAISPLPRIALVFTGKVRLVLGCKQISICCFIGKDLNETFWKQGELWGHLGRRILCCGRCPIHHGMLSSILGLHLLDASSSTTLPEL